MDANKGQRYFVFLLCASSWNLALTAVDRTREDRAVGADIVQAVVDIIRENCIYPNDRVFLRRLAYVESKDGLNTNTFRHNYYGGIWQVDKSEFESTKHCYGVEEMCQVILDKLNIDWRSVTWNDLTKPLYSGLAASLKLQQIAGNNTPGVLESQADFWVNNYQGGQSALHFISEVQKIPEEKCQIDLAFILDGSGSITFLNFLRVLDFVKNVTKQFDIGSNAVQVAAVSFSDYSRIEFGFGDYNTHNALKIAIDSINYDAGGTNTASGIRTARRGVFHYRTRPGVVKVGIVITDGYSNSFSRTVQEAEYAKKDGIVLFAIGIGDVNEMELNEVASNPNCTHVFFISQFSEIESLVYEIRKAACRAPILIDIHIPTISPTGGPTSSPPENSTHISKAIVKNITDQTDIKIPPSVDHTDTKLNVSVNCGIVHIYTSYDNPHPSPVLYNEKITATDGHPAVLYVNRTVDGHPLYITFIGTQLPQDASGLKNCSDATYTIDIAKENKTDVEIVCRQNQIERECTKLDFERNEKYKDFLCSSSGALNTLVVANPCTATAIQNNEMYHPHPYDDTKFIKCDFQQKMYITQCPNGERYHQGSHSCGSTTATITSDKTPLDPNLSNPCTAQALMNHQFFFAYTKDNHKFIHCDVWGHAWVLNCPSNLVWNQQTQTCIEDTHTANPCTQALMDQGITMFPHHDPHKYIHCDNGLNPWVQSCVGGTVFDYASQNCVWQSSSILG